MTAVDLPDARLDDETIRGAVPRYPHIAVCAITDARSMHHWRQLVSQCRTDEEGASAATGDRVPRPRMSGPAFAWRLASSDGRPLAFSAITFDAPDTARRHARRVVAAASRITAIPMVSSTGSFGWQIRLDDEPVLVAARSFPRELGRDRALLTAQLALRLGSRLFDESPTRR
jgi:hypothetical protein